MTSTQLPLWISFETHYLSGYRLKQVTTLDITWNALPLSISLETNHNSRYRKYPLKQTTTLDVQETNYYSRTYEKRQTTTPDTTLKRTTILNLTENQIRLMISPPNNYQSGYHTQSAQLQLISPHDNSGYRPAQKQTTTLYITLIKTTPLNIPEHKTPPLEITLHKLKLSKSLK